MASSQEIRRSREDTSVFSRLFDYIRSNEADLAAEGRRSVLGGLLSKEPVAGTDTIRYEGIGQMLSGLLDPVAKGIDAPRAAYEGLIPEEDMVGEAFGTAGTAMGGGSFASTPSGALTANKLDLDPLQYQSVKMDDYLSNADVGVSDMGVNLSRKPMSWEDLEGDFVIPFYGDRTSGGMSVDRINDVKFDRPVLTEGGGDFMRGPAAQVDDAVWASNSNITKRLSDRADTVAKDNPDRRVIGMTGSMAPNANDFATMTGGSVGELIQGVGIPRQTANQFDEIMRAADPDFVGVNSPNLRTWLEETTSPLRKTFIRLADTKPMKDGGFPDMGLGRYAVTDVTQRDMPPGMFGLGAAQIDTSAPRMFNNPKGNQPRASVPHNTYNSQIAGEYLGSLTPVPQGLLFKDLYDKMDGQVDKNGNPLTSANKTHAIKTIVPASQITPQVLEGILSYISKLQE